MNHDLTIDVDAKVTVSNETAERCLRLLEMWQDDHPDCFIEGERVTATHTVFRIKRRVAQ